MFANEPLVRTFNTPFGIFTYYAELGLIEDFFDLPSGYVKAYRADTGEMKKIYFSLAQIHDLENFSMCVVAEQFIQHISRDFEDLEFKAMFGSLTWGSMKQRRQQIDELRECLELGPYRRGARWVRSEVRSHIASSDRITLVIEPGVIAQFWPIQAEPQSGKPEADYTGLVRWVTGDYHFRLTCPIENLRYAMAQEHIAQQLIWHLFDTFPHLNYLGQELTFEFDQEEPVSITTMMAPYREAAQEKEAS